MWFGRKHHAWQLNSKRDGLGEQAEVALVVRVVDRDDRARHAAHEHMMRSRLSGSILGGLSSSTRLAQPCAGTPRCTPNAFRLHAWRQTPTAHGIVIALLKGSARTSGVRPRTRSLRLRVSRRAPPWRARTAWGLTPNVHPAPGLSRPRRPQVMPPSTTRAVPVTHCGFVRGEVDERIGVVQRVAQAAQGVHSFCERASPLPGRAGLRSSPRSSASACSRGRRSSLGCSASRRPGPCIS